MRTQFVYVACYCMVLVVGEVATLHAASMAEIVEAWKHRTNLAETLSVKWRGKQVTEKHIEMHQWKALGEGTDEASFQYRRELRVQGSKLDHFYYWTDCPVRNGESGDFEGHEITTTVFGDKRTDYFKFSKAPNAEGRILAADQSHPILLNMKPIFLTYRPLNQAFEGFDESELGLTSETGEIDGSDCLIIERRDRRSGRRRAELWVDPERDHLILRYRSMYASGAPWHQVDIQLTEHVEHSWVPASWTITTLRENGSQKMYLDEQVEEIHLNRSLSDTEFAVNFETGTMVTDYRGGGRKWSIVSQPGQEQPLDRDAAVEVFGENMEDVFPNAIAELTSREPNSTVWWWVAGIGVVVVGLWAARRRLHHRFT